ncbi:tegument protein UL51 [Canid alphaherpesvirus 1]|uniref:Tegument protein UL51 n=1 Tax=Canid alphaherpesvirus 1 TaxID=170325 RepID=A0A172DSN6_9ALPH|nr:tegument protein UL51 [Canid alphaherpesvirus 1]ALL25884.1 tegument protein UL51 [Canid alphaherpesvirus 1]ALL25964.1 tegument protein UL51 [Canid alphaherpesvirus 1]ALL26040.1 tegument protein UL51 [Canid alphaherpesvirus 1]ARE29812.1 tegument protein UL51 [Canid alphaherpesvirus 1]QQL08544.1 tegument protein UL51 [Canid alphaherpesvirus 1]
MFRAILSKMCGNKETSDLNSYELIKNDGQNQESLLRLQEALVVVNTLIPLPLTINDVISSFDETKRLIQAQSLARTYQVCQRNLECLSKHQATSENPNLNAVVESHIKNAKRLSDSCLAAIVHLYLSVGSVDVTTDTIVNQAIKMTSENNIVMADVAVLEKTLGIDSNTTKPLSLQTVKYDENNSTDILDTEPLISSMETENILSTKQKRNGPKKMTRESLAL